MSDQEANKNAVLQSETLAQPASESAKSIHRDPAAPGEELSIDTVPSVDALQSALGEAARKADEYRDELLRARAELENVIKRSSKEVVNAQKYALERFVADLLPVKDSLDLGRAASNQSADVAAIREGLDLTVKMLEATLSKHGIKAIEPQGERFNPELHQAMTVQESKDSAPGTVLDVVQKGYSLNDRLLRPAMVIVAKAPDDRPAPGTN
ncbi:MAG: nucleotide exchange factor GrpE [Pseudomonadota bacterium]|nr:nucleotide exchange factor GrpE [Pseudomonadota bacterium]